MSNIHFSNFAGTNIQAGEIIIPPGVWVAPNTSELRARWNDGTNSSIADGKSYHVATFGQIPTVEETDTVQGNFDYLMVGFGFIFMMGLTALGARWVRRILTGGLNE